MNPPNMDTYEARLASFEKTQAGPKRRNSNAKGAKGTKWPHKSPGAVDLARAGFFFRPTTSAPDNVQCFSCGKELDGWDEEDVAILEHRQLSPDCGFALNLGVEYDIENDRFEPKYTDPVKMLDARKATFRDRWPHEDKRGWTCKTQKMAEGGWYHCPTLENDDMVKCAYCGLSLDGWEPKDNPLNEHQRRAPDCVFFSLALGESTKASRAAKGRLSKASRMSMQSNATIHTIDDPLDIDDSAITNTTSGSTASTTTKKAGTGRKPRNKVRDGTKPEPDKERNIQDVDMGEPEDAGFDVAIPMPASKPKRGKKRPSEVMVSSNGQNAASEDVVLVPPSKRRAIRVRSNNVRSEQVAPVNIAREDQDDDAILSGKEDLAMEQPSKRGGRGARKRASSAVRKASNTSVRKASNTSTATKAALRAAVPTDEEVDAALAAELDRPLTDEEIEQEVIVEPKAKTRRLTRTKPSSRTASRTISASTAPIRKTNKASAESGEDNLRCDMSKGKHSDSEQIFSAPSQDIASLEVKPKKGRKVAKMAKAKSVQNPGEASLVISSVTEPEQLTTVSVGSPEYSTTMLHHDIATKIYTNMSTTINDNSSAHAKDIDSRVSAGPISRERSISHETMEVTVEEKLAKARKVEVKVEIQRLSFHGQQQIGTANENAVSSAANDEKDGPTNRASPPKKQNIKKAKGKATKDKAGVISRPEQSSIEPVAEEVTPVVATKAVAPKNNHINSPAIIVNVEKQAARVGTEPPTPQKKVNAPSPSPQSSDAENHPPSTRPVDKRPPLAQLSPSKTQITRVPLAASTPTGSPSKRNAATKVHTDAPWSAIDLENFLGVANAPEEGLALALLSTPEKRMTVEEWIVHNAAQGEERLRRECERIVGAYELEGVKALRSLEGIACVE